MGLCKGDTLIVKELDRLGRNKAAVKEELEYWKKKGVRVQICDIPTTMQDFGEHQDWIADMVNNILIEVCATIAEQERLKTEKRRIEGMNAMPKDAKGKAYSSRTGRYTGRPKAIYPDSWSDYYARWKAGEITAKSMMDALKLKRTTFYKLVKMYEEKS